jgi:6-phosphofructokinase 1
LRRGFEQGKRLGLMIRNEMANPLYTTEFIAALFEEEGGDLFDVRTSVLGHMQQGGNPTPFDRILAARMAARAVELIERTFGEESQEKPALCVGMSNGNLTHTPLDEVMRLSRLDYDRPKEQWWMDLRGISRMLAKPEPMLP